MGPAVIRKQVLQLHNFVPAQNYIGVQVLFVGLVHEFSTPATRRKDVDILILVFPHRDDGFDPVLAGGDHGADRGVLGTESHT